MDFFYKLRSTVTSAAAQVQHALPGNVLLRECQVGQQIATAGPGLLWRIYAAKYGTAKKPIAVWVFEKRDVEKWAKQDRDMIVDLLKNGIARLTRIRHPRMLIVEHPLDESRDSLVFCTEPIFASLANLLGRVDNMVAGTVPEHLVDFKLHDVEIRHGLMQVSEALAFLHHDARMMHRNVCTESILVNERGQWKLAGFDFAYAASQQQTSEGVPFSWPQLEWDENLMPCLQPSLDFIAPEHIVGGRCDANADMFSLGILCVCSFTRAAPLHHEQNLTKFRKNMTSKIKPGVNAALMNGVSEEFREDVKQCLNWTPDLRPDATQFSKVAYFEHITVKTLNYFEALCQLDYPQKAEFFKGLPNVLPKLPKRVLLQKVMPLCATEIGGNADLVPFVLPSVFLIGQRTENREFAQGVFPFIVPVFAMRRPPQVALILLQNMELLLKKTPENEIRAHVLPLIYAALDSDTPKVQELCLGIIPNVGKLVDRDAMKMQLLPKLLRLSTEAPVLSVRVNALVCLGRLVNQLEKWMVTDQVVPTLTKVQSHEPGVLMAVLGIYKLVFTSPKLGMSKESCARHALPYLIAASVTPGLNVAQFEQFMQLIRSMLDKVENEHRQKLEQLSALQQDQIAVKDFNEVLSESAARRAVSPDLQDLVPGTSQSGKTSTSSGQNSPTSGGFRGAKILTLEEKKRLANEQDHNVRLRQQQPLRAVTTSANQPAVNTTAALTPQSVTNGQKLPGATSQPVDLSKLLGPSLAGGSGQPPATSSGMRPNSLMSSNQSMGSNYRNPAPSSNYRNPVPTFTSPSDYSNPPISMANYRLPPPTGWQSSNFQQNNIGNGMQNGAANFSGLGSSSKNLNNLDLTDFDSLLGGSVKKNVSKSDRGPFDDLLG